MDWLEQIHRHVESTYPEEGCGLVFKKGETRRVVVMPNSYDKYRARFPETYPRTNRTAYLLDPPSELRARREADEAGETLELIFHSHCDVGAYFSSEDAFVAAPDGVPLHPGVGYLVVAVDQGRATGAKTFVWQGGRFVEKPSP